MSIKSIDVSQAPAQFSELLALIAAGEEVVIEEHGKAVARLVPAIPATPRIAGLHEGQGWSSEDFDAPLPDDFWTGRV